MIHGLFCEEFLRGTFKRKYLLRGKYLLKATFKRKYLMTLISMACEI